MHLLLLLACAKDEAPDRTYQSEIYRDRDHWLCHPDADDDVCSRNLDTTVVQADGSTEVVPHERAADPAFDCFYVYPTVSNDTTSNADLEPSEDAEVFTVFNQAARLSSVCRVFAPVYRQVSLLGLAGQTGDFDLAFADVEDAWKHYLAQDNKGRGVILMGHSQGAGMLHTLTQRIEGTPEFDPVISVWIIGNTVSVPAGEPIGGDFATVPACGTPSTDGALSGCVLSWLSFRAGDEPDDDLLFGLPRPGHEYLCSNPANVSSLKAELGATFATPWGTNADLIGGGSVPFADPKRTVDTPFFSMPELLTGECLRTQDGVGYLSVRVEGDPADPRADDIGGDFYLPGWGLHLVDVNVVLDDLVALAPRQHAVWRASQSSRMR